MMPEISALKVRRAVVVAPHPDDETIGAFGLMRRLSRAGARVTVIIVTDGGASHPGSQAWPPERLKLARRRETLAAARLAGVFKGSVRFLDYPDGSLTALGPAGLRSLARRLAAGPRPDLVARPSLADAHPDHAAVARACRYAWPPCVYQAAYMVWPEDARPRCARPFPLGADQKVKPAALRLYRTQTGQITDDPEGFCMDRPMLGKFSGPREFFGRDP